MVVPGYWDDPAATAENIVGGYWRSGDIGSMDAEGYVRMFDRKKDMINRGGYKIYSVEVENALMSWPGVVEAAVVAKPCPVLGERVHAFVVAAAGVQPRRPDAPLRRAAGRLQGAGNLHLRDAPLPRNANGKLMKRSLRAEMREIAVLSAAGPGAGAPISMNWNSTAVNIVQASERVDQRVDARHPRIPVVSTCRRTPPDPCSALCRSCAVQRRSTGGAVFAFVPRSSTRSKYSMRCQY